MVNRLSKTPELMELTFSHGERTGKNTINKIMIDNDVYYKINKKEYYDWE